MVYNITNNLSLSFMATLYSLTTPQLVGLIYRISYSMEYHTLYIYREGNKKWSIFYLMMALISFSMEFTPIQFRNFF